MNEIWTWLFWFRLVWQIIDIVARQWVMSAPLGDWQKMSRLVKIYWGFSQSPYIPILPSTHTTHNTSLVSSSMWCTCLLASVSYMSYSTGKKLFGKCHNMQCYDTDSCFWLMICGLFNISRTNGWRTRWRKQCRVHVVLVTIIAPVCTKEEAVLWRFSFCTIWFSFIRYFAR